MHGLLMEVPSPVVEHRFSGMQVVIAVRLSSCDA